MTLGIWKLMELRSTLWQNSAADFLGSVLAGLLLWWLLTVRYSLAQSRTQKHELLAVAYAPIKRELDAAIRYGGVMKSATENQLSLNVPITQAWETLHSTGAFKLFGPKITEKLVKCYSLLFRLRKNVEVTHMLLFGEKMPVTTANEYKFLRLQATKDCTVVVDEFTPIAKNLCALIDDEVKKLPPRARSLFEEAYEEEPPVAK